MMIIDRSSSIFSNCFTFDEEDDSIYPLFDDVIPELQTQHLSDTENSVNIEEMRDNNAMLPIVDMDPWLAEEDFFSQDLSDTDLSMSFLGDSFNAINMLCESYESSDIQCEETSIETPSVSSATSSSSISQVSDQHNKNSETSFCRVSHSITSSHSSPKSVRRRSKSTPVRKSTKSENDRLSKKNGLTSTSTVVSTSSLHKERKYRRKTKKYSEDTSELRLLRQRNKERRSGLFGVEVTFTIERYNSDIEVDILG